MGEWRRGGSRSQRAVRRRTMEPDSTVSPSINASYDYNINSIKGFCLTHLPSGGGSPNMSDIPFLPTTDSLNMSNIGLHDYAQTFSHGNEVAQPGYCRVGFDSGNTVELTATRRAGFGRFTFAGGSGRIPIDGAALRCLPALPARRSVLPLRKSGVGFRRVRDLRITTPV
jgi:hypothetical protein